MPRRVAKRARLCRRRSCWSDLPPDLLREVIHRLPAIADRLRLGAVCRRWRRAERAHPHQPAPMPWLAAAGHCVCIHDAAVHRVALPDDARAAACRGSFGNWLALVPISPPPCEPFLLNPFSMARIPLPAWTAEGTISKIVLSSAPDSEHCTVAAVVGPELSKGLRRGSVAVCRLKQKETSSPWWRITETFYLEDIAFFQGKLHAVDGQEQAYVFEDGELDRMRSWPLLHRAQVAQFSAHNKYYLVPCHGRLLMVCRSFGTSRVPGGGYHTVGFKVSAVSQHSYGRTAPPPPAPVKSFDGHALFVGDACCGAFAVVTGGGGGKIREDQICYADDETNTRVAILGDTGPSGYGYRRPLRLLQSYDMGTKCFRRYQPGRQTGPWQCVTAQRLLHREALPPPPATELGDTLLLWEVMSSLGSNQTPCYCRSGRPSHDPDIHVIDLIVLVYDQGWRFTQTGRSVQEAKQKAAREAVGFLRSRYRRVLDDSPWSSVPHSQSNLDEDEYEDDIEGYQSA